VSPVKYEVGFYIREVDILHSHCYENRLTQSQGLFPAFSFLTANSLCQSSLALVRSARGQVLEAAAGGPAWLCEMI
jgi:hypothetical protein